MKRLSLFVATFGLLLGSLAFTPATPTVKCFDDRCDHVRAMCADRGEMFFDSCTSLGGSEWYCRGEQVKEYRRCTEGQGCSVRL